MSGCGAQPWVVGQSQSVLDTGCIGVATPEAQCEGGEQDLLKLDGADLYFGQRSVNLCNERAPTVNQYPVSKLARQIVLDQADLYPEGIALRDYRSFFVSSVGTGKILNANVDGNTQDLVAPFALGGSTLGLKHVGDYLWSCVSNTQNLAAGGLAKLNAQTGEQVAFYGLPNPGFCNDLVADQNGNVYVTESFSGIIYKLSAGSDTLVEWLSGMEYIPDPMAGYSFNGLALSNDERELIIGRADTGTIVRVQITESGDAGAVSNEVFVDQPIAFIGIDGVTRWRGELFVVRNFGIYKVIEGASSWTLEEVLAPNTLRFPTAISIDHFGNMWIVESQLFALVDGDPQTNAELPFRIVRLPYKTARD